MSSTARTWTARTAAVIAAVVVLGATWLFAGTTNAEPARVAPAPTATEMVAELVAATNTARADEGLAPLQVDTCLVDAADEWVPHLEATDTLEHRSDTGLSLAAEVDSVCPGRWTVVGENLGVGPDMASIQDGFMHSPTHRANILDGRYTHIGISVGHRPGDTRPVVVVQFGAAR